MENNSIEAQLELLMSKARVSAKVSDLTMIVNSIDDPDFADTKAKIETALQEFINKQAHYGEEA